jgi:hypothetical protein
MIAMLADMLGAAARALVFYGDGRHWAIHRATRALAGPLMALHFWLEGRMRR